MGSSLSKKAWKFQEAAVAIAIEGFDSQFKVVWNHDCKSTPEGMSIDPDVLVYQADGNISHVVFVTHVTSETGSQKKFWRTVAEAFEAKKLVGPPNIGSILFSGSVKPNLLSAYKLVFDGAFHLDDFPFGEEISSFLMSLTKKHGSQNPKECRKILAKIIKEKKFPNWREFKGLARNAVYSDSREYRWDLIKGGGRLENIPVARETRFRNGVAKLLTFQESLRGDLFADGSIENVPAHAVLLGWVSESLADYELDDADLIWLRDRASKLIVVANTVIANAQSNLPTMNNAIKTLQNIDSLQASKGWILGNFDTISTARGMEKSLASVYQDPQAVLGPYLNGGRLPGGHWLIDALFAILLIESGDSDGYGYATLQRETGIDRVDFLVGPYRLLQKDINSTALGKISEVFARHMRELGKKKVSEALASGAAKYCKYVFNYKVATYREFNPIDWLVCDELAGRGIGHRFPMTHNSIFSEGAGAASTGKLISVADGRVWIKCQSAFNGRIDKRKELCGRIGAIKLTYSSRKLAQKRFYLLIDGFFDANDIQLLLSAGWDGVWYFDEIDQLVEVIKRRLGS